MKRKIISIIKSKNLILESYKSFRSDMGWQQYNIWVSGALFEYSYLAGQENELIIEFNKWVEGFNRPRT